MTDETKVVPINRNYEAVISFIPKERALMRVSASSEEMAKRMILDMATDNVTELTIESLTEIKEGDPVPEGYEETPREVEVEPKKVH